jgi:arylsulfatase A-like enzyme
MRLLSTLLAMLGFALTINAAEKPNIVFILADDLGYTDLACYGSKYYETPNIDRLAKEGMRFTDGHSSGPNCQPSRAAMMSGQYGPRTGVYTVGNIDRFNWQSRPLHPVENVTQLPMDKITIAQALKDAGYATGMFGKWHLGHGDYHPGKRGFDEAIESSGVHFNFKTDPETDYPKDEYLADFLTDKATDFIRRHKEQPFFLYLPHFAVHQPLQAKKEMIKHFEGKTPVGGHNNPTYAAMIKSVDDSVGRILALLDELKLADNTLVIFSSDNGGVGGYVREGVKKGGDVTDNAPLRGGKGMLYEGGHRVPWIFRWPGKVPEKVVCDQTIIGVDLYPTLLDVAGVKRPANYTLDGLSYAKVLTTGGKEQLKRDGIFWHFPGYLGAGENTWRTLPVGAVRSGDWKLMEFFEDHRLELYNLKNDLGEKNNLAEKMPDKTKEMLAKLHTWQQEIKAPMPTPNTEKQSGATKKQKRKGKNKTGDD